MPSQMALNRRLARSVVQNAWTASVSLVLLQPVTGSHPGTTLLDANGLRDVCGFAQAVTALASAVSNEESIFAIRARCRSSVLAHNRNVREIRTIEMSAFLLI